MGRDEIRVGIGLCILAAGFAVIGPIAEPWNYGVAGALLIAGLVMVFWHNFRPKPVSTLFEEFSIDVESKASWSQHGNGFS